MLGFEKLHTYIYQKNRIILNLAYWSHTSSTKVTTTIFKQIFYTIIYSKKSLQSLWYILVLFYSDEQMAYFKF